MHRSWRVCVAKHCSTGCAVYTASVRDPLGNWSVGEDGELDAELDVFDLHFYADAVRKVASELRGRGARASETPDLTTLLRLMVRNMDKIDAMEGGAATVMNLVAAPPLG